MPEKLKFESRKKNKYFRSTIISSERVQISKWKVTMILLVRNGNILEINPNAYKIGFTEWKPKH
jgi:hypothetical protein